MATPNQIMDRFCAMRASRIAMQRATEEKERLAKLTDTEKAQEMWEKMSPMDRHMYLQLKASRQVLPVMAVIGLVVIVAGIGFLNGWW